MIYSETTQEYDIMTYPALSSLLKNQNLKISDYRLLAELLMTLETTSFKPLSTVDLSTKLDVNRSSLSASLGRLERAKIIQRGTKIGRLFTYRLIAL
ncbi:hypothetical protein GCM10009794_18930 [Rothia terrae]